MEKKRVRPSSMGTSQRKRNQSSGSVILQSKVFSPTSGLVQNRVYFSGKYRNLEKEMKEESSGAIRKRLQHATRTASMPKYSSVDLETAAPLQEEVFEAIPNQVH